MRKRALVLVAVTVVFTFALATEVVAGDGVLEINHACATTTGCFPGDSAGYPVTIDGVSARSFLLTSDLRLPIGTSGIQISTSNAMIDLNGFSISRSCWYDNTSGSVQFCVLGSSGAGIEAMASDHVGIEVRDGAISFMGGAGIALNDDSIVRNVRVSRTGGGGISMHKNSLVEGCTVSNSGAVGIGASGVIRHNAVSDAGAHGISAGTHSTISENKVSGSGLNGIIASDSVVRGNAIEDNTQNGIAALRSVVIENISTDNTFSGIACTECVAMGNRLADNGVAGISTDSSGAYGNNVIYETTTVSGFMTEVSGNVCNGNSTCP